MEAILALVLQAVGNLLKDWFSQPEVLSVEDAPNALETAWDDPTTDDLLDDFGGVLS